MCDIKQLVIVNAYIVDVSSDGCADGFDRGTGSVLL